MRAPPQLRDEEEKEAETLARATSMSRASAVAVR